MKPQNSLYRKQLREEYSTENYGIDHRTGKHNSERLDQHYESMKKEGLFPNSRRTEPDESEDGVRYLQQGITGNDLKKQSEQTFDFDVDDL